MLNHENRGWISLAVGVLMFLLALAWPHSAGAGLSDWVLPGDSPTDRCPAYKLRCQRVDIDVNLDFGVAGTPPRKKHLSKSCRIARVIYKARPRHHGGHCRRWNRDLRYHLNHTGPIGLITKEQ